MNTKSTPDGEQAALHLGMADQKLIRLNRLKEVLKARQVPDRQRAAYLTKEVGSQISYWSGMLAADRPFGEQVARKIEDKLGLGRGYLDELSEAPVIENRDESDLLALYRRMSPLAKAKTLGYASGVLQGVALPDGDVPGVRSAPKEAEKPRMSALAAALAREFDSIPEPAAQRIAYSMCMAAINQATHPDIGEHAPGREPSERPGHDPEMPPEEDRAEPRTKRAAATKAGGPQS